MLIEVVYEGLDAMISRLEGMQEKVGLGAEKLMAKLGEDSLQVMQDATHVRSGRLKAGDKMLPEGLGFRLFNEVYYAPFVERGHKTPRGWNTKHGWRPAKEQHWVEARPFLKPAEEYATDELMSRLATLLED